MSRNLRSPAQTGNFEFAPHADGRVNRTHLVRAGALVAAAALLGGSVVGLLHPELALGAQAPYGRAGLAQLRLYAASVRSLTTPRVLGWDFGGPSAIVLDGPDVFVGSNTNQVVEVKASTGALVRRVPGFTYHAGAAITMVLDGPDLFVASETNRLTEVNASTGALVRVISGAPTAATRLPWCPTGPTCS